jgi:hypothetical protein
MPHHLTSLQINEISVVDAPANSEVDPVTGRKIARARVALFKRDSDTSDKPRNGEKKKMGFQQILKSATTRDQIVAAVERKATKIAKRDRVSLDAARVKAWTEHPEAFAAYEAAPLDVVKRERKTFEETKAEAELDMRARKRMKRTGSSYAKAVSEELEADPSLYVKYEREMAAGARFVVPEPPEYSEPAVDSSQQHPMYKQRAGKGR